MPELNGSAVTYPTIELGGVTYTVKFTRGTLLYRLSKSGVSLNDLAGPKSFATTVDILHATLTYQFSGTAEDLAELILAEEKIGQAAEVIGEALKKVSPPTREAGTAGQIASIPVN